MKKLIFTFLLIASFSNLNSFTERQLLTMVQISMGSGAAAVGYDNSFASKNQKLEIYGNFSRTENFMIAASKLLSAYLLFYRDQYKKPTTKSEKAKDILEKASATIEIASGLFFIYKLYENFETKNIMPTIASALFSFRAADRLVRKNIAF